MAPALIMLVLSVVAAVGALLVPNNGVLTLIQYIALFTGYYLIRVWVREERRR